MRLRWVSIFLALVFGVRFWSFWQPGTKQLLWAIVGISIILLMNDKTRSNRLCVFVLTGLLGSLRVSLLPTSSGMHLGESHSVVFVQHISGKQALVENETERWLMNFYSMPPQGSIIGVWHTPLKPEITWKGGRSKDRIASNSRAPRRKSKDWVLLQQKNRLKKPKSLKWIQNGGVLWALIAGDKSGVSRSVKDLMRRTGTSHLLAISGLHIGMLAVFTYNMIKIFFGWFFLIDKGIWAHRIGICCSIGISIWYGNQVGWSASSQRAVCMITIVGVAKIFELDCSIWDVLGLAGIIILLKEPSFLYDLGFQLSFSAVAGIAAISEMLIWRSKSSLASGILASSVISIGATIGTLPIVGWTFQGLPPMSVVANFLVAPILGTLSVTIGMLAIVLSQWDLAIADIALVFADASIQLSIWLLEPLEQPLLPLAFTHIEAATLLVILVVGVMIKYSFVRIVVSLAAVVLILFSTPLERAWRPWLCLENTLTIRFLNVGQGDASVLEWGDGDVWLIDGGPFSFELVPYLRREGIWYIDQVWLSHPHRDHFDGLIGVFKSMPVGSLVVGRYPQPSETEFFELVALANRRGVEVILAEKKYSEIIGTTEKDVQLLHPFQWGVDTVDRCNEESLVLKVCQYRYCVLFTGDVEEDAEAQLLSKLSPVDILKVAHHGSKSSTSERFLRKIQPKHAVISSGRSNRFNHPHPKVLANLRESVVWRTDTHGTIVARLSSSGVEIDAETFVDKP